jgi:hypothetical protein
MAEPITRANVEEKIHDNLLDFLWEGNKTQRAQSYSQSFALNFASSSLRAWRPLRLKTLVAIKHAPNNSKPAIRPLPGPDDSGCLFPFP